MIVDTHCHLDDSKFDADRDDLLKRAREQGVELMISIGTTLDDSRWVCDFVKDRKDVLGTVGMHPEFGHQYKEGDLEFFRELSGRPGIVAVGEVGMDFHYEGYDKKKQESLFRDMIGLAREKNLPLVIHQRDAEEDTLRILRDENAGELGGVFHCFAGSLETAKAVMDLGFYISVGGILTFKNAQALRDVVDQVPLESLVLETDAPWLAPQPVRGKRNEPAYTRMVAEKVAEMKAVSIDEVERVTTQNAKKLFKLETK